MTGAETVLLVWSAVNIAHMLLNVWFGHQNMKCARSNVQLAKELNIFALSSMED